MCQERRRGRSGHVVAPRLPKSARSHTSKSHPRGPGSPGPGPPLCQANGVRRTYRLVGTVSMFSFAPNAEVLAIIWFIWSARSASSAAPKNAADR